MNCSKLKCDTNPQAIIASTDISNKRNNLENS